VRPALVNGAVGTATFRDGQPFAIAGFTIRNQRIVEMDIIADPERLNRLDLEVLDGPAPHLDRTPKERRLRA
jgi:hypothetical protein